ncbi:MAG: cupin domain-containing protein [Roseovarius sp.]|nr:cupin domain-containing protein [Roseovarius sp.]
MQINTDFTRPVIVHGGQLDWVPSPAAGVERKMLYRDGAEVARATSIVRYAPGSAFPEHVHSGGEEILVLSGTFQDEHGDYPAGSYFRNPPGTSHSPAAAEGCEIFVRLWQFREGDTVQIAVPPESAEGVLFDDGFERVSIEDWQGRISRDNARGLELLVLSGRLRVEGADLGAQGWLRLPAGHALVAEAEGARVWIKDAPLQHGDVLPLPGAA